MHAIIEGEVMDEDEDTYVRYLIWENSALMKGIQRRACGDGLGRKGRAQIAMP